MSPRRFPSACALTWLLAGCASETTENSQPIGGGGAANDGGAPGEGGAAMQGGGGAANHGHGGFGGAMTQGGDAGGSISEGGQGGEGTGGSAGAGGQSPCGPTVDCKNPACASTVECGWSCETAVPLGDPSSLSGTTADNPNVVGSAWGTCNGGAGVVAAEEVYLVTPSQTGQLRIRVTSEIDSAIYVRSACTSYVELGCVNNFFESATEELRVQVEEGQAVYVFVDSPDFSNSVTFALEVESFPNEAGACGDDVDNDQDGLADCEDSECFGDPICPQLGVCAAALVVHEGSEESGDTSGGTSLFQGSCVGSGRERVFQFHDGLAGAEGVLYAWVDTDLNDDVSHPSRAVYTRKDCIDPSTESSCQAAYYEPRAWLHGDEPISIFVDTAEGKEGPFTLHVSYTNAHEQCELATVATLGDNIGNAAFPQPGFATSLHGMSLFEGSCTGADLNAEKLFTFTPETSGTLTATLITGNPMGLYVRADCLDAASELACVDDVDEFSDLNTHEELSLNVTAGEPLTIVCDGTYSAIDAEFVLHLALTAD